MGEFTFRRSLGAAVLAVVLLATACGSSKDDSSTTTTTAGSSGSSTTAADSASDPLGPINTAKGAAVKVGVITDGTAEGINNDINNDVAKATVKWLNERMNGLAGHEIVLDLCVTENDPGKASDCANQLITDKVVAVVVPASAQVESIWSVLQPAGIPVLFYGTGSKKVLDDGRTGFTIGGPAALLVDFPAGLAKAKKVKKVSAVVIDVPAATDFYKDGGAAFDKAGLDLKLVPVPPGTADMTPQMQQVVSNNPDGIVTVVGNDSFCIAAFNGLRTAGFKGTVAAIPQCITDATKKAVPADFLEGMQIGATTMFPDTSDPSIKQYLAVLDAYGAKDVDHGDTNGATTFSTVAALNVATADLQGDVTPASVAAAIKSMKEGVIPGTGGLKFRCNGKADPAGGVAICSRALLAATLDASGNPSGFKKLNDDPIPD
jgi:branched-chain amino acid transport system substrate-binding protein